MAHSRDIQRWSPMSMPTHGPTCRQDIGRYWHDELHAAGDCIQDWGYLISGSPQHQICSLPDSSTDPTSQRHLPDPAPTWYSHCEGSTSPLMPLMFTPANRQAR